MRVDGSISDTLRNSALLQVSCQLDVLREGDCVLTGIVLGINQPTLPSSLGSQIVLDGRVGIFVVLVVHQICDGHLQSPQCIAQCAECAYRQVLKHRPQLGGINHREAV